MRQKVIVNDEWARISKDMPVKYSKILSKIFARKGWENDEDLNHKCLVFTLEWNFLPQILQYSVDGIWGLEWNVAVKIIRKTV
jgi:hypothetical protein